jgi:sugar transferase (PEP-CTERM/EpsH1 system associated)
VRESNYVRRTPLVAHVIHRLAIGGLENGLVNLINCIPRERFRHAIVCLSDFTEFRARIRSADVEVFGLGKRPGIDLRVHGRLWKLLRALRPSIVHTRNLAALEFQWIAAAAGVSARVHGEHGWDTVDLHGKNPRYNVLRRATRAVVGRYIALSRDIERWLIDVVRARPERVRQIYNGVDIDRFHPAQNGVREPMEQPGFAGQAEVVFGTVGRLEPVKNPLHLIEAFIALAQTSPGLRPRLRLAVVGDGSLRSRALQRLEQAGLARQAWLPGSRDDIPRVLRSLDVFVLPSLNEGISNTILEAMATGLPVVATRVGGNPELVEANLTGFLTEGQNVAELAEAMRRYAERPELRNLHGGAGRARVESHFSLAAMAAAYMQTYDEVLAARAVMSVRR